MSEAELEGVWIIDPVLGTRLASLTYHFQVHGSEVMASSLDQYLRKALAFAQEKRGRGRDVLGSTIGTRRWSKQNPPWYIDMAPNGEIVSFGSIK